MIRVQDNSRASIELINQPLLRLDQNSTILFGGLKEDKTSLIDLMRGSGFFFSRAVRRLEVRTPFVNAGVEGTEFFMKVDDEATFLSLFEGRVIAWNDLGSLTISSGQSALTEAGKMPATVIVVRPRDAVQWALFYPRVTHHDQQFTAQDPRFFTQQASALLSVGRVAEAKAEIEKALALDPNNSQAFALQSVIAVTQSETQLALELAEKAVATDPQSATALIALSYARQSAFDLEGARDSLQKAVLVGPDNALAWARLAEILLSFGQTGKALEAAKIAVDLDPDVSRTHVVLGFTSLLEVRTKKAREAFLRAIELDQADPLPRLGLGMAKIREGGLPEGRRDIEIAVSLDPENSLLRSYLGKAYFDEKQDGLAARQFDMAKNFDPLDPTPHFYAAILQQTANRPVEALIDLQRAIELNDNRAVHRSRLLLDADLAARSTSLARIYSDLGFEQLALVEGWKSVNTDPGNFSAHRFLSDSYAALPRHEIARVSELLQSQLLQPLNIAPIQPRLAESRLNTWGISGPLTPSMNELNALFTRNRVALQASGIAGENQTFGNEVVASGLHDRLSVSAGQYHYETDGWRENSDFRDTIYNVFGQVSLAPNTSVQAEYRKRTTKKGDIALRFAPDDFSPNLREEEESSLLRFGLNHGFSPESTLLGSFMYQEVDRGLLDDEPADPLLQLFDLTGRDKASGTEIQHRFKSRYLNLISGAGYFDIDSRDRLNLEFLFPDDPPIVFPVSDEFDFDTRHANVYVYAHLNFPETVRFTLGGSGDFLRQGGNDINQFNPKLGLTWNPMPDTTLRAAAFRVLKRTLVTDQTLEPTQVAGFNQFFDDFNAADSWRYGIAADQKFSERLHGGVEYAFRDLEVPFLIGSEGFETPQRVDWEESLFRSYLYWTPRNTVNLSAEYLYEDFKRDADLNLGANNIQTHRIALGCNYFHPSGLGAMLKGSYYHQDLDFERMDAPPGFFESGRDQFWLFDAAVSYRLPKRFGMLSLGVNNIFDTSFNYHDTDLARPAVLPKREVYAKITLVF